jgi:zinc/manganese transport system substrate-binding protein
MHWIDGSVRLPKRRLLIAAGITVLTAMFLLAACGPAGDSRKSAPTPTAAAPAPVSEPKLTVVATFSILADLVANVGGDRVAITTLVGPDSDAHVYSPTPSDAKAIASAALVFVNGLGFEGWIDKLIKASGYTGTVVVAAEGIRPLKAAAHAHGHGHGHAHDHGELDPHGWQSPVQAQRYVENIARALIAADPKHEQAYRSRATAYIETLRRLDEDARARFAAIPAEQRRVITGHDAFGYFGDAYAIRFFAPRGMSTEGEASAKGVARLITQIRSQKIRAVFVENISDPRLVEQLARESGAKVGGVLFSDALSVKDARARTYLDMMRHNVDTVAAALVGDAAPQRQ